MSDFWGILKRLFAITLYGAFLFYMIYLYAIGATIVQSEYANFNHIFYAIIILFALYKFVFYGVYPVYINFSKVSLFVIGLLLIIVGQYVLLNDPLSNIHIADIVKILGVMLIVLSPTNVFHNELSSSEKKKGIEIIEV